LVKEVHTWRPAKKIITKSSTEAELVAIANAIGQILWTRHFLVAQGIPEPATTIYQDNKSMLLLSENSRLSSSKRTQQLSVRYFSYQTRYRKEKSRSQGGIMSYREQARRLLHKASAGFVIQENAGYTSQSALQQN